MSGICIDGIRAALARKADCARCSNAWKCNELTGCYGFCEESEEPEEEDRDADEEAEEEIEEVMLTNIIIPHGIANLHDASEFMEFVKLREEEGRVEKDHQGRDGVCRGFAKGRVAPDS